MGTSRQGRAPKHRKIADQLRAQIRCGGLAPGQALPPYRALMARHGATVGVVRQAMQTLQAEGLVESVPRIGCRVAQNPEPWRRIGVIVAGYAASPYHLASIKQMHDEFERLRCEVALRFVETLDEASLAACAAWAGRRQGVVLTGRVPLRLAEAILAAGVPAVQIGELADAPEPPGRLSAVLLDVPGVARLAVSHLISLGHRRLGFYSLHGTPYYDLLARGFAEAMKDHGLVGQGVDLAPGMVRTEPDAVLQKLQAMAEPPTAILAEEGGYASALVRLLNASGWPVPERVSVLAVTATAEPPWVLEGLTCVLTATREFILRAAAILDGLMRDPAAPARLERLSPVFVPGRTCRAVGPCA